MRTSHLDMVHIKTKQRKVMKPPQTLICCSCGCETLGRQWYNRDKGFGICTDCAKSQGAFLADQYGSQAGIQLMKEGYGLDGVHYTMYTSL